MDWVLTRTNCGSIHSLLHMTIHSSTECSKPFLQAINNQVSLWNTWKCNSPQEAEARLPSTCSRALEGAAWQVLRCPCVSDLGKGWAAPLSFPPHFLSYCDRGAGSEQELKLSRPHHASLFPPSMALGCLTHATCSSSCRPKEEQNISFLHTGMSHSECKQDLCYNNANSIA